MTLPKCMTEIRSDMLITTPILCSMSTMVYRPFSFRTSPTIFWVSSGESPAAGSSSSKSRGAAASAMASSSCRCSPWEISRAGCSALSASPTSPSAASARSRSSGYRSARRQARPRQESWRAKAASHTLSAMDSVGKMLVRWKDRAMPRWAILCGGVPAMSRPSKTMRPAVGASCPVSKLKKVVLPAPLGPITECSAPS